MKDGKKLIITIGRQLGSGSSEIGRQLVTELGLGFYDRDIPRMDSDGNDIEESSYYMTDEEAGNELFYKIIKGVTLEIGSPSLDSDLVSADNLPRFQSEVIRKPAIEEDCVLIGWCVNYALEETEGLVRMSLYRDMDYRVRCITEKGYFDQKDVKKNIKRNDRERRDYYRYYTGQDWQDMEDCDVMLNTVALGTEGTVRVVRVYLKIWGYEL